MENVGDIHLTCGLYTEIVSLGLGGKEDPA